MAPLPNTVIDGWQCSPDVERWAHKRGFGDARPATDIELRNFSRDNGGAAPGLYLWEDSEHHIYIGIATKHVVTRLRSHVRTFLPVSNIQSFRYLAKSGSSAELRGIEQTLIHSAIEDKAAFVVMNREHAAVVIGDSVFDKTMSPDEQLAWLDDPTAQWTNAEESRALGRSHAAENAWSKFSDRSDSGAIVEAVALYARLCIPHAVETEYEWWVVTCPGWTNGGYKRVCTVNMAFLEMLYFSEHLDTGTVSVSVGTDYQFLPSRWQRTTLRMSARGKQHSSGGPFEEMISFDSVDDFMAALRESSALRRGAARFALDRMRKGRVAGRYRASHSPQLAIAALNLAGSLDVSPLEDESTRSRLKRGIARLKARRSD